MYAEGWIKTRNEEDTKRRRHETKKTRNEEDTKRKLHRVGANSYKTADDSSVMASSSIRSILALQVQFSSSLPPDKPFSCNSEHSSFAHFVFRTNTFGPFNFGKGYNFVLRLKQHFDIARFF